MTNNQEESKPRLTCAWCGAAFSRPHRRGPAPRFCSRSHRQRAYEARKTEEAFRTAGRALAGLDTGKLVSQAFAAMDANKVASRALAGLDTSKLVSQAFAAMDANKVASRALAGLDTSKLVSQAFAAMDANKIMSRALAELDARAIASLAELGMDGPSAAVPEVGDSTDQALLTAALGVAVLLVVVVYLLPTVVVMARIVAETTVEGGEFGLELIEGLYNEYPAVRGALYFLGAVGSGISIHQFAQSLRERSRSSLD